MDELEITQKTSEELIAKSEALIKQGEEMLARSAAMFAELGIDPDKVTSYTDSLEGDRREYYESEMQSFRDELNRDIPPAAPPASSSNFRASRTMV